MVLLALIALTALSGSPASAQGAKPQKNIPGPLNHAAPAALYCDVPAERDLAVIRKVYEVGQRMNVSEKVMLAGFETGWVESRMNNLSCGDRDSLGVFQQRPSQGWGSPEQVMDVDYAAGKFFEVALQMDPGMEGSTAGQLAQAVQRSAYPDRYDQAEDIARRLEDEAFQPYGTIGAKYDSMGGPGSVLGGPVRAEEAASLGGRFQLFQNGMILWHPDVAYAVYGDILTRFWATDAERRWGFPTMDEADAARAPDGTRGRYQFFERGLFLWSPSTGTHVVHDAIYDAFHGAGHESVLGYPTTDEVDEAGGGRAQRFQKATIHWHPDKGTWITDN
ncbi:LGFP repeat protein [Streptomyces cyanogenus]|uniref:LGFP repeat protein n=2 Tax=Streptomyces cyanogenus TaxID=80860 RepID=A0ABX7U215_STRCY|nr:LGFP repeat protein [Streptomyces cyanogenus]